MTMAANNNATTKSAAPAPSRMTLGAVKSGRISKPLRVLLYGIEGVGKTTFGAGAPNPIFLGAEDGHANLDVAYFPEPHGWSDVLDAVKTLANEKHSYETLVLDTLDWLEPFCWRKVCETGRKNNIEEFGYGKGYVAALEEWRGLVAALETLRRAKRMHVVMLAHSQVKTFQNPEGENYDRYSLKLNEKAAGLMKEWSDDVLFTNYETHVLKDGARAKAYGGGERVVYTQRRAAFDAKNRNGLPETMALSWEKYFEAVEANRSPVVIAELSARVRELLAQLPDSEKTRREQMTKWLATPAAESADALRAAITKVQAFLGNSESKSSSEGVQS